MFAPKYKVSFNLFSFKQPKNLEYSFLKESVLKSTDMTLIAQVDQTPEITVIKTVICDGHVLRSEFGPGVNQFRIF